MASLLAQYPASFIQGYPRCGDKTLTPCQQLEWSKAVVVGAVISRVQANEFDLPTWRFRVERQYKGDPLATIDVETPLQMEIGERHLLYLACIDDDYWRLMPGSAPVEQATEDLALLESLQTQPHSARVEGKVLRNCEGVPGARVELQMDERIVVAITDDDGHFAFEGLEPGEYGTRATKQDLVSSYGLRMRVKAGRCHSLRFSLRDRHELSWSQKALSWTLAGYDWVVNWFTAR